MCAASGLAMGCHGAIGGDSGNGTGNGPGVGTGNAGSGVSGVGTGNGGSAVSGVGTGNGGASGGSTGTGAGGTGVVTLPNSALQSGPLLRLANYEFMNSLNDILGFTPDVVLEPDAPSTGDFRIGGPAGDNTVTTYHTAAMNIAAQALKTLATIEPCYGTAATGAAAAQAMCANTIASDLGPKFYRRPLDPAQLTSLNGVYSTIAGKYGFQTGVQALLEALIQSPYFLYHLELEEESMGAGAAGMQKVAVTGYSMASRLSYLLWGSTPDSTLMTAAGMGQLTTTAQIQAQATRMLADQRVVPGMRSFYEQWLKVLDLPTSKVKNPVTNMDYGTLYSPAVQTSLRASFDAQVDAALWGGGDTIKALLSGSDVYVDGNVASIFGVTGVTGTQIQKVTANAAQRAGIITHPAIMSVFATDTSSHPIKRGVFFWDKFLCNPLPNPPPDVPAFVPPPPGQSLRQDFEIMTAMGSCPACHSRINPVGFLFEHYDSMGYYTNTDSNGQPVNSMATVFGTNDPMLDVATTDAVQFAAHLAADDSKVASCMVNQIYRYAMHRHEFDGDAMSLASLTDAFNNSGRSVKALLAGVTQTEAFLNRVNVP
ncbi:MAG TPA: DUF1592 domain-containing protein [Polyangia bacterium]|nr:DUF1592 domain-containing protein [Polyangia bacterium]